MPKNKVSDVKDPQGHPPQYPQQGNPQQQEKTPQYTPQQQGYPPEYTAQQAHDPQQGYAPQQGCAPQQGYAQYPAGSNVIVTQPQSSIMYVTKPPDYLVLSILVCLFCICPIGIVSIIFSCSSRDAYTAGDVNTAQAKGSTALTLNIFGIVLGIIWIIVIIVFVVAV